MFDEPQLAALCLETIDKNTPEALGIDLYISIGAELAGSAGARAPPLFDPPRNFIV